MRERGVIRLKGRLYGTDDDSALRVFVIIQRPGMIPEKKIPLNQTADGVSEFLIEAQHCCPAGTVLTVVQLVWDGDIWVDSGSDWLAHHKAAAPRKFAALKRKVIATTRAA